jgi:hypothetical protein
MSQTNINVDLDEPCMMAAENIAAVLDIHTSIGPMFYSLGGRWYLICRVMLVELGASSYQDGDYIQPLQFLNSFDYGQKKRDLNSVPEWVGVLDPEAAKYIAHRIKLLARWKPAVAARTVSVHRAYLGLAARLTAPESWDFLSIELGQLEGVPHLTEAPVRLVGRQRQALLAPCAVEETRPWSIGGGGEE